MSACIYLMMDILQLFMDDNYLMICWPSSYISRVLKNLWFSLATLSNMYIIENVPTAHWPFIREACSVCMKCMPDFRKIEIEKPLHSHAYINPNTYLSDLHHCHQATKILRVIHTLSKHGEKGLKAHTIFLNLSSCSTICR